MAFVRFLKKLSISRILVRSLKSQILRVKNVKNQNLTHPKAAKLAILTWAPAGIFPGGGGGQTFVGAPKKSVKGGPHFF